MIRDLTHFWAEKSPVIVAVHVVPKKVAKPVAAPLLAWARMCSILLKQIKHVCGVIFISSG
jgi:hypothetical protein